MGIENPLQTLVQAGHVSALPIQFAEYIQKRGRENVTTDDIVRAVRPEGRSLVPDAVKAELLAGALFSMCLQKKHHGHMGASLCMQC